MTLTLDQLLSQQPNEWKAIREKSAHGQPFVLICSSVGGHGSVVMHDSLLATALSIREARTEMLLCDGVLPACEACSWFTFPSLMLVTEGPQKQLCGDCWKQGQTLYEEGLGLPVHRYSHFLSDADRQEAKTLVAQLPDEALTSFTLDEIPLGAEALAGAIRYFYTGALTGEPHGTQVLRKYLEAAILTYKVTKRFLEVLKPDVLVFHHGIYVPQGVIGYVARQAGVRVVNWAAGYKSQTLVYSHTDTYHRTMIHEPVDHWKDKPLTAQQKQLLEEYLETRQRGIYDWVKIYRDDQDSETDEAYIRQKLGLDDRPVILMLTNVLYDAQIIYPGNAFPSLIDWVDETIRYFTRRPDLQLVIRMHPSEVNRENRQLVSFLIEERFPHLPENIKLVHALDNISTYALGTLSNCTMIYGTKTGVELAARGVPVMVAGEAWIRNKGMTIDITSVEEYHQRLDELPLKGPMSPEMLELAQRYAYHFFFRRMVRVNALKPKSGKKLVRKKRKSLSEKLQRLFRFSPPKTNGPGNSKLFSLDSLYQLNIQSLEDLKPGKDPGLDALCQGIMHQTDFIYDPYEKTLYADRT